MEHDVVALGGVLGSIRIGEHGCGCPLGAGHTSASPSSPKLSTSRPVVPLSIENMGYMGVLS